MIRKNCTNTLKEIFKKEDILFPIIAGNTENRFSSFVSLALRQVWTTGNQYEILL